MEKLHYYCFSFIDEAGYSSCYKGQIEKEVTLKDITQAKIDAQAKENAVLLAVSYLGYMTKNKVRNVGE